MNNKQVEEKLKNAFAGITPDILDTVLSDCSQEREKVIIMTENNNAKKKQGRLVKIIAAVAAAFVLVCGGAVGLNIYTANYGIDSTISLDVNPSIEITTNKNERVIKVTAKNQDAENIIDGMELEGSDLDVTINALVGSMLKNGYLSEIANSILISVDNANSQKSAELQKKLTDEINAILNTSTFNGAVLSQVVTSDKELAALAEQYGISVGKAQLISKIVSKNSLYKFEDLVALSINDLNLLSSSGKLQLDNVSVEGTASEKGYIGVETAKSAAYKHAGVSTSDVKNVEAELDFENGIMVYEIDFDTTAYEYSYDINAITGDVVKQEKELNDFDSDDDIEDSPSQIPSGTSYIGKVKAKQLAFAYAGVSQSSALNVSVDFETENGVSYYDVDFDAGIYEYSCEIDAVSGKVLNYEKDADDDENKNYSANTSAYVGEAAAKKAALAHAGVLEQNIREYEIELEQKNKTMLYEIEFSVGNTEYSYEINAETGKVVKYSKEIDD